MTPAFRTRVAALAAATLSLILTGSLLAPAAQAAPVINIDPTASASLHIHKLVQPEGRGQEASGLPEDTTDLTPLAGVSFTVQRIGGIDLTTNAGWRDAGALTVAQAVTRAEHPGITKTTDAAGDASFTGLPLGLYLVSETAVPAGVTPGAPFLVTLPMTHPEQQDTWLYDVHVYPKNAVTGAEKTVHDAPAVVTGDDVVFTVTADIPMVEIIDGYRIVDQLDSRLEYRSATVKLSNGAALAVPGDAEITFAQRTNTVMLDFSQSGREILAANAATAQVVFTITTTARATGVIPNEAIVYPNAPSFEVQPGEPGGPIVTPPVETKWGALVIEKVDADNTDTRLADAVFQVFTSEADARDQRHPLTVAGESEFTTGPDGRVAISGLRYSNFVDGKQLQPGDPDWLSYWITEVRAPAGYELLATPVRVDVLSDDPSVVTITVENVPHNGGFQLPRTGLAGTVPLVTAGVLLLAGAVTFGLVRRRRHP